MFDFRYHALSLVAVFLALGIGILLGVTIGDSLVSEAEQGVRASLRTDVIEAREEARELRGERERLDRWIERAAPAVVDGRLAGRRVAIVALGRLPDDVESPVRDAIEAGDGRADSRLVLEVPIDERALGDAVGGRFARLGSDEDLLEQLGRHVGSALAAGGRPAARLDRQLGEDLGGDLRGADAVVLYRHPGDEPSDTDETFIEGLLAGLGEGRIPIVGVERSGTEPSQIDFYRDHGVSSVDSVDLAAGRAALVLALAGAEGSFGFKPTADDPLPRVAEER